MFARSATSLGVSPHRLCEAQHCLPKATSFCVRKRNDVFALRKMMLTASGQMMLCPKGHKHKKIFLLGLTYELELLQKMKSLLTQG